METEGAGSGVQDDFLFALVLLQLLFQQLAFIVYVEFVQNEFRHERRLVHLQRIECVEAVDAAKEEPAAGTVEGPVGEFIVLEALQHMIGDNPAVPGTDARQAAVGAYPHFPGSVFQDAVYGIAGEAVFHRIARHLIPGLPVTVQTHAGAHPKGSVAATGQAKDVVVNVVPQFGQFSAFFTDHLESGSAGPHKHGAMPGRQQAVHHAASQLLGTVMGPVGDPDRVLPAVQPEPVQAAAAGPYPQCVRALGLDGIDRGYLQGIRHL